MNISGVTGTTNNYTVSDDPLSLKKAIKAYQDERLTGLTEEERAEIERRSKEYLESNPINSEHDREAFNNFVKSLLKKYGFKGEIDELAASIAGDAQNKLEDNGKQPTRANIAEHFNRASMGGLAIKNKFL